MEITFFRTTSQIFKTVLYADAHSFIGFQAEMFFSYLVDFVINFDSRDISL